MLAEPMIFANPGAWRNLTMAHVPLNTKVLSSVTLKEEVEPPPMTGSLMSTHEAVVPEAPSKVTTLRSVASAVLSASVARALDIAMVESAHSKLTRGIQMELIQ